MKTLPEAVTLDLSGSRFTVTYRLTGTHEEAQRMAQDICIEQTVEFPEDLLPSGFVARVTGRVESLMPLEAPDRFEAVISFADETTGYELPQLLNVIFGNISIKPGIRVEGLALSPRLLQHFRGPQFGQDGLRRRLNAFDRPLLSTALKPMGLSALELSELAYQFALGGIDIIKDDHGLADQPFAPWRERVLRCADAVARANAQTGGHSLYMPNLSAPAEGLLQRAHEAAKAGAGGLLVAPGLTGFDAVRALASAAGPGLPVMSHPAWLGSFVTHPDQGISHGALFGHIMRLAGADATVFPNYGGRFSFRREECLQIAQAATLPMGDVAPMFPAPGGGMTAERVADMLDTYGQDVIFLIGGGLFRDGGDVRRNSESMREALDTYRK